MTDNEGIPNVPDETALYTLWYTDALQNASDYLANARNETANSTIEAIVDSIELSESDDPGNWYVETLKIKTPIMGCHYFN